MHQGQHKKKRRLLDSTNSTGTLHHGVTKEAEQQQRGRYLEDTAIGANHQGEDGRGPDAGVQGRGAGLGRMVLGRPEEGQGDTEDQGRVQGGAVLGKEARRGA